MVIPVKTANGGYNVIIGRGELGRADEHFDLSRRVLVITDDGVPVKYAEAVAAKSKEALVLVIPQGEASKNFDNYKRILKTLLASDFTRGDCIVAVGGGVVGDMAGFAAATYMRGIDFYNIPTTLLSQVDSSVGGKTAIDFGGYKNTVGAFYPPKAVIIDPDTLKTLDDRQISNGLAEVIKMAATSDSELFDFLENEDALINIEDVICRAVSIKKAVVQEDEHESGLRRVLNFGHTVGHAIESNSPLLLHGECVGVGMLYMSSEGAKNRIEKLLEKYNLPTLVNVSFEKIKEALFHDKKAEQDSIVTVRVNKIGSFEFRKNTITDFSDEIERKWN